MSTLPKGDLIPGARPTQEYATFFKTLNDGVNTPTFNAGTTAERPTRYLSPGSTYYDTTLGKPIWVNSINPIVWHDASGSVV